VSADDRQGRPLENRLPPKLVLGVLALALLTASGLRLAGLDRKSWVEWKTSATEQSLIPRDGSLIGISASTGIPGAAEPLADPGEGSVVLLFTVHAASLARDVG
jgi:hypothetical protein